VYVSSTRSNDAAAGIPRPAGAGRIPANVIALGMVSLVTDISSEMVTAILPVYMAFGLGLSPLGLGFVDGLYGGITALVRLAGGHLADRTQGRKAVAGFGYGISAVCKLGLLHTGASVGWLATVIGLDRTGKGLRTAPRDALTSLSSPPESLGRSFGVHRAMDTAGAVAGPLVAFLILWAVPGGYDAVFVASFFIAMAALVILAGFVRDHREPLPPGRKASLRSAFGLLKESAFRRTCLQATLLGLVTLSDAFVYLLLQRRLDIAVGYFPLLPLGTAVVYLASAVALGRLADRIGRWRMFLYGNLAFIGIYGLLLSPLGGAPLLTCTLALHGLYYAATNGVLMADVSPALPPELRTSGLALVQTGTALAALLSSIGFGAVWSAAGPETALQVFLFGLLLILLPNIVVAWRRSGNGPAAAG
jgi:MFS family permease